MNRRPLALLVVSSLLVAGAALAQKPDAKPIPPPPAPPPTVSASASASTPPADAPVPLADALTGDAKADYEAGRILFGDGDFAGALVKFTSAYDRSKDPRLSWNMAACEKSLRHYAKAAQLVRRYIAEGDARVSESDKADATRLLEVLDPLTAKLTVTASEAEADLSIDGEAAGTGRFAQVVDLGMHHVVAHKDGFEDATQEVLVRDSMPLTVALKMKPIIHEGRLDVSAAEGATITLDGKVAAIGRFSGVLPSGGHTLRVTAPDKRPYQTELLVEDGKLRKVQVTLEDERKGGLPTWVWIGGGVLLAGGAAAGIAGGVLSMKPGYSGPPGNLGPGIVQASFR